jgi:choice-of-anchor A domain-containing protein
VLSHYFGEKVPDQVVLSHQPGTVLTLTATDRVLGIFQVSAAALRAASGIRIEAPYRSSVLINVLGDKVALEKVGVTLSGIDAAHVLWNLPQATTLTVANAQVEGSVLAPHASLDFNAGQIHGSVTVLEARGNGFFKNGPYAGPYHK